MVLRSVSAGFTPITARVGAASYGMVRDPVEESRADVEAVKQPNEDWNISVCGRRAICHTALNKYDDAFAEYQKAVRIGKPISGDTFYKSFLAPILFKLSALSSSTETQREFLELTSEFFRNTSNLDIFSFPQVRGLNEALMSICRNLYLRREYGLALQFIERVIEGNVKSQRHNPDSKWFTKIREINEKIEELKPAPRYTHWHFSRETTYIQDHKAG